MTAELLAQCGAAFLLSFVVVMLVAARSRSLESLKVDIRPDEVEVDRLDLDGWFSRRRLVATSYRIVLQDVHWLFARTRQVSLPVRDLDGARLEHRMNGAVLLAGLLLFSMVAPLGLLVVIFALVATRFHLVFGTRNHRVRFPVPGTAAMGKEISHFFRTVQRQREVALDGPFLATPLSDPSPAVMGRIVSRDAWLGVFGLMVVGAAQRLLQQGIDLETAPFLALYCAIPVLVGARRGGRDGFVTGFFGMFGLVAVLYPFPTSGVASAGAEASPVVYAAAAVVAGALGGVAGALKQPLAAVGAVVALHFGWFLVAAVAKAPGAWSLGLATAIALSIGACCIALGIGHAGRALDGSPSPEHGAELASGADAQPAL